jgi:hypothetical protein
MRAVEGKKGGHIMFYGWEADHPGRRVHRQFVGGRRNRAYRAIGTGVPEGSGRYLAEKPE